MSKSISQREARRLRRRVVELERERSESLRAWARAYPGGTHIATVDLGEVLMAKCTTAKRLGFPLVATVDDKLYLHAVRP